MNQKELEQQRREYLASLGYRQKDLPKWSRKWRNLKARATRYERGCSLSFEDYVELAKEAGVEEPTQIGAGPYMFQMGRFKDQGDYRRGNCSFIPREENLKQRWEYKNK